MQEKSTSSTVLGTHTSLSPEYHLTLQLMKLPLSIASGRSVLVLTHITGNELKYEDSSISVPLSDTTQKSLGAGN